MLNRLNEQRSRRVGTFPVTECEGGKRSSGKNLIETPEDSCVFLPHASSEKSAVINFPGIFVFNSAVLWKEESVALWLQTKIAW